MSKSHRREDPEREGTEHPSKPGLHDPSLLPIAALQPPDLSGGLGDLSELWARGNQAASERLASGLEAELASAAGALAERAATALRIVPRDSAWTERMLVILERSALPPERKELIALRLRTDQALADEVTLAVTTHLGADGEALRSTLIAAFERAAQQGEPPSFAGRTLSDRAEDLVVAGSAAELGLPEASVRGLLRDLVLLVAFGWDEEEGEPAPGDYAAEESGW